jgi:cysteinyl-tRNA synthetase
MSAKARGGADPHQLLPLIYIRRGITYSGCMATIRLSNTLSRTVETLTPLDPSLVKMYVCGPTVYAPPHIGNARSVVVYDVLYRLLKHDFADVKYVRNITDVDDKINAAAVERGISIRALTEEVTAQFHHDMAALNCLAPTVEPRATEHIAEMIGLIEALIEKGFAYAAEGHVLFRVQKDEHYGLLSRRPIKDMIAGARVEVAPYKEYPGDFVLWKPASERDDASAKFDSPWGAGRPGWHIECSAMAGKHLGLDFDIHGGGADLMFPHHENEIAQSTCAHTGSHYAKLWVHNGFLTVDGEKMSKSLGNFITVDDLLKRGVKGEVIRFALLSTRYNEPLDWSEKLLSDSQKVMDRLYRQLLPYNIENLTLRNDHCYEGVVDALRDNLNTPRALALLQGLENDTSTLLVTGRFLGLLEQDPKSWFHGEDQDTAWIDAEIARRNEAKKARDFAASDAIRDALKAKGIILEDSAQGTSWRKA